MHQFPWLIHLANLKRPLITNVHQISTKEIMAPFFSINIAWGKFQEREAPFSLVLSRKAMQLSCYQVEEIIYGAGALVRYLPPYSPDCNPIEESYHQAKDFIRENDAAFRCCLQPHAFILHAFEKNSPENCEGYFRNFGYERQFD